MKKIIVIFYLLSAIGFANNTFTVHIGACALQINDRYKLKEFNAPYNFNFTYLESEGKEWISNDNLFLQHNINIYFKENYPQKDKDLYISKWKKMMVLFSNNRFRDLEIWRFKNPEIEMNKKGSYQEIAKTFSRQANVFIIFGKNFIIHIDETDPYIDEIYNMIKDCK